MKELEDISNTDDFDEVDTKIGGYEIKQTMDDSNIIGSHKLPDLICSHEVHSLDWLPDLVNCGQTTGGGHQSTRAYSFTSRKKNVNDCWNLDQEQKRNFGNGARVPSTPSPEKDDMYKVDDRFVPTNGQHQMIPGKTAQEESKSSWAQTGRQLARVAEQARDKRNSQNSEEYYPARKEADPVYPDHHNRRQTLAESSVQHSDLLSTLILCGISYLVNKIVL